MQFNVWRHKNGCPFLVTQKSADIPLPTTPMYSPLFVGAPDHQHSLINAACVREICRGEGPEGVYWISFSFEMDMGALWEFHSSAERDRVYAHLSQRLAGV